MGEKIGGANDCQYYLITWIVTGPLQLLLVSSFCPIGVRNWKI